MLYGLFVSLEVEVFRYKQSIGRPKIFLKDLSCMF